MRSLPAALLSLAVAAVPALTFVALPSDAGAASAAGRPEVLRASSDQTAPAHPVAGKVTELVLRGVAADAVQGSLNGFILTPPPQAHSISAATAGPPSLPPAVLTRATNTAGFQTLGVTWATTARTTEPDLLIWIRTHGSKGWSPWASLDDDAGDDDTATGKGVRGGTDPLWVGPSDGVQVRVVVHAGKLPAGLKLALVDAGTSGYDVTAASTTPGATANALTAAGTTSAGGVAEPLILSRATWGADESRVRYTPTYMPTIKATVMHHTAGPNNYSPSQVPSIIRGDYAYHLSRGWSDIGYNALVDRFGRIWEGRAGGLTKAVMGAHAGGFNYDTFGVSVIGNYDVAHPSTASVSAVARVMAWKLDLNHRDPNGTTRLTSAGGGTARYKSGTTRTFPVIMGHRNTGFTACPGRYLYPYLPSIRRQVKAIIRAALTNPSTPPASVLRGSKVSVTAGSLAAQSWRLDVTGPCGVGRVARISGSAKAGAKITATWNGRLTDGSPAAPGRYTLTVTSHSTTATARPVVRQVLLVPPALDAVPPGTPSIGPGGYQPVTPTRLLDTKAGGQPGLGPNGRVDVPVLGSAGIPLGGVTSVVLNLTASCVSDDTALAVWPSGSPKSSRPVTALSAGSSGSVLVTARVGADGAVSIGNAHGVVQVTADVLGYYLPGGLPIRSISSTRIYDSRNDHRAGLIGPLAAGQTRLIPLPDGLAALPAALIRAVIVDVSALSPTGSGTLTAYQPGAAGNLPTLGYRTGQSSDNLAIAEVSDGMIALKATGTAVNAVLDVRAVIVDGIAGDMPGDTGFTAIKPRLILDTSSTGGSSGPRKVLVTGGVTGVPAGASAVLINVTGVSSGKAAWAQVTAFGQPATIGTAIRVPAGGTRGNLVVVPIGAGGAINLTNPRGLAQVRIDVHGYFR
jgi:hypothetical protein